MLTIDKSRKKIQIEEQGPIQNSYHHLSIPYKAFSRKSEKFIYNGSEKMYFTNRKKTFKKVLRQEVLHFLSDY